MIYAALATRTGSLCSESRNRISKGEARGPSVGFPRGGRTADRCLGLRPK